MIMEGFMKVSEVMHEGIIKAQVSDSIRQIAKLMKDNDIGSLPVFEQDSPVGFVTDRDIVLSLADDDTSLDDKIDVAMSPELIAVDAEKDLTEAARIMEEQQISRLLVTSDGKAVGIVTLQDLSTNVDNSHLKSEIIEQIKQ